MKRQGHLYKGILYAGLMVDGNEINVIEFNVRFGDPECQCVLPLLETDLLTVMQSCCDGTLDKVNFSINDKASCTVILASAGYPQSYEINKEITGLETTTSLIYHAGTKKERDKILTNGGRVLSVTSIAETLEEAREYSYSQIENINFEGCYFRKDIGIKNK